MAQTKILVTGDRGFIGSHVVQELSKNEDHTVFGWDRREGQELSRINDLVFEPDYIIHLAGSCSTPLSLDNPLKDFKDNLAGTLYMLEYARKHGSKVIHTSTCKAQDPVRTPYGVSKRSAENYCLEYAQTFGVDVAINRPGTVYGLGQEGSSESGWVAWFKDAQKEGLKVTINGDGSQTRDLLHVSDYVALLKEQIELFDIYKNQVWEVGGGLENEVSVKELADYLKLDYSFGPERIGDAARYVADNDVIGPWKPKINWWNEL